jgi:photosystem II stability/assembly factor-like uncharacterized protein
MSPNVGEWVSIGPTLIVEGLGATGRITTIAIDPTQASTIYVGGLSGNPAKIGGCGVWKTVDGGVTWLPFADGLPSLKVGAIAIDPTRPSTVYVVTYDLDDKSGNLYRSDDAGGTWNLVGASPSLLGRALIIDPSTPSQMFVATAAGIHRSTDSGATWMTVLAPTGTGATDLATYRGNPSRLLAGIWHPTSDALSGIYETRDSGNNWRKLVGCPGGTLPTNTGGKTIRIAMVRGRTYVSFKTKQEWTLYRTRSATCTVAGQPEETWELRFTAGSDIAPTIWSYLYVHPVRTDIVYATGTSFRRSTDGGTTFSVSKGPHADHHAFAVDPGDNKIVYTGCDGGLYRSNDSGASESWAFAGEGMANTEFYDLAHAPTNAKVVIGGTQDNGTLKARDSGTVWDWIRDGDGATVDVDPTDDQVLYAMYQYADSIAKQTGGGSWQALNQGLPIGSVCFNLHFQVHPRDPEIVLASCASLWRTPASTPPGAWESIFPPSGYPAIAGSVSRSAVDASRDIYYAATTAGELYAGVGGAGWQRVFDAATALGSARGIADVRVDVDEPAVYLGLTGELTSRIVLLRRGGGQLTMAATDITGDLPVGVEVTTIAVDRTNLRTIYAGTKDRGVYRGRFVEASNSWKWDAYGTGLPPAAAIEALITHPTTGVMRAGTCGRGAYEVYTDPPIGSLLAIEGVPIYLRAHDAGGYGPPTDFIDGEVVVRLDSAPHRAFGFPLRADTGESAHLGMVRLLRSAMNARARVRIDYLRTGVRNGKAIRVMQLEGKRKGRKVPGSKGVVTGSRPSKA